MYASMVIVIWIILTLAAMILPLIRPFRRWTLDQMEDHDNTIWDYLTWLEKGVVTPMEALGMVVGWLFVSIVFCTVAFILALLWPIVLFLVPMTFLFYKLFKRK
jgi:hypothetical protein